MVRQMPRSPRRARSVAMRRNAVGRIVLAYDGKPAPFPVIVEPRLRGLPIAGQALAESFREGA